MDVVIVGTGGQAREIHAMLEELGSRGQELNVRGFLDDDPERRGVEVHGKPVLGSVEWLAGKPEITVAVGIGSTRARSEVVGRIEDLGPRRFPVLVHPAASVGRRVRLGAGTIVGPGAVLTTDIQVGRHALLNFGCTIGHDVSIGDFATVAPGAHVSGNVQIDEGADIGTGVSIVQGRRIGAWATVGAGAAVVDDVPAERTVAGVPAVRIGGRGGGVG